MSNVPLAIRLRTSRADRRVTADLGGIDFRAVSPGGFASATIKLDRPLLLQPDELESFGRLYIYDRRHAGTIWEGRCEDLGRTADASGTVWEISAVGPSGHVHDQMEALYYVVNDMQAITVGPASYAGGQVTSDVTPDTGVPALKEQFPQGSTVTSASTTKTIAFYPEIRSAGKKIARVKWHVYSGFASATDWAVRVWMSPSFGVFNMVSSSAPTIGDMGFHTAIVGTDFSSGEDQVTFELQWIKVASGTIGNDNTWIDFWGIIIQQVLVDAAGNEILTAGAYVGDTVTAAEIVTDLLGRMLPLFDGPNAEIDTSNTFGIEQLAYTDGTDAGQVLDDLMSLLGTHTWEAGATNPATGLWTFTWRPWPTDIRYEATVFDGYQSPITASTVYDQVLVRWKQNDGRVRTSTYTQSVGILDAAAFHRTGFVDLSDAAGTQGDADQAGAQFLADNSSPANSGTLTIARPILDRYTARWVQPWEIQPGYLVRIRGVDASSDDMLNIARNGSSICRIVGIEYTDAANQAQLDLDSYPIEQAAQIKTLQKQLTDRRRR